MASGTEVKQSLEPSSSTYTAGIEGRPVDSSTPEIYYSAVTSKKPASAATARRTSVASADSIASLVATEYTGIKIDVGNSIHLALSCRFSVVNQSASVFFALYDAAGSLIGVSRSCTFVSDFFTDGTLYVSPTEIVDVHAASFVTPIVMSAPSSGTVSIYAEAL